jgi:hypothetical protein
MLDGEFYSFTDKGSLAGGGGVHKRLKTFGVTHGMDRVVIVVCVEPEFFAANDERTSLVRKNPETTEDTKLPWKQWGDEYRHSMPEALSAYVREQMFGTDDESYDLLREFYLSDITPTRMRRRRRRGRTPPDPNRDPKPRADPDPNRDPKPKPKPKPGDGLGPEDPSGGDQAPGQFWPSRIEWVTFPADSPASKAPCEWTPGPSLLQMNEAWPRYVHLVKHWSSSNGIPEEDAREIVKRALVYLMVNVIGKTIDQDEPEPGHEDLSAPVFFPSLISKTMRDMQSLVGYVAPAAAE